MNKPIDVNEMIDDSGSKMGWIAKGTYTKEEMIAGILFYEGEEDYFEVSEVDNIEVKHFTMRCIPEPKGSDNAYSYRYEHSKPGRGAFKCTIVYLD